MDLLGRFLLCLNLSYVCFIKLNRFHRDWVFLLTLLLYFWILHLLNLNIRVELILILNLCIYVHLWFLLLLQISLVFLPLLKVLYFISFQLVRYSWLFLLKLRRFVFHLFNLFIVIVSHLHMRLLLIILRVYNFVLHVLTSLWNLLPNILLYQLFS